MEKRDIERISALTRLSRQRELTSEEQAERQRLRENYLRAFRGQFKAQLENTVVEYPDGSRTPLKDVHKKK